MKKFLILSLAIVTVFSLNILNTDTALAKKKKKSAGIEIVEYESIDGFNIKGKIYIPKLPKKEKAPLVVLMHSLGKDRNSWQNLPDLLKEQKFACLVLDLRGHGKSIYNKNLKKRSWNYFTHRDYSRFPSDIIAAIDYVQTVYHKKIDTNQLIFVGSDIGSNTAIVSAAKLNKKRPRVISLVLISPTLKMKGLFTPIELVNFGKHPVLIFVSHTHKESYRDTYELRKYAQGPYIVTAYHRGGIGAVLYKEKKTMKNEIVNWCIKVLNPQKYKEIELSNPAT